MSNSSRRTDPDPGAGHASRTAPSAKPATPDEQALLGYEMAIQLWTSEGELIWAKFNALLVANSIILAIIGITLNAKDLHQIVSYGLPFCGILLCALWYLMTRRGFDNYSYWILSARELEEQALSPIVQTTARGGLFADGGQVRLLIGGRERMLQMSKLSRRFKASWVAYGIIGVFAALYLILFFA